MKERNYKVIKSDRLSKPNDDRFVIVLNETNQVIDDAKGYGYKSKVLAHKGFSFLTKDEESKNKFKAKEKELNIFCLNNISFVNTYTSYIFKLEKYKLNIKDNFNETDLINMLIMTGTKLTNNINAKDLYNYLMR